MSKAYRLQKLMLDQEPYYETHTKGLVTPPSSSDDSDSKKSSSDSSDSSKHKYIKPEDKVKKAVQNKRHTVALNAAPAGLSLFVNENVPNLNHSFAIGKRTVLEGVEGSQKANTRQFKKDLKQ